ncbi:hypothetical protein ACLKA6_006728 [Drosophila palustris]
MDEGKLIRKRERMKRVEVVGGELRKSDFKKEELQELDNNPVSSNQQSSSDNSDDRNVKETVGVTRTHISEKKAEVHSDLDGTIKSVYTIHSFSVEEDAMEEHKEPEPEVEMETKSTEPEPERHSIKSAKKTTPVVETVDQQSCNCCRMPPCPIPHKMPCSHMYPTRYTCGRKTFFCYPTGADCNVPCCYQNPPPPYNSRHPY